MLDSKMPKPDRCNRLGVVAHDAGGAEILASYVKQEGLDCIFVLTGPAKNIFGKRLGSIETVNLQTAISQCDCLLTGTGWQTDFEWQAIHQGKDAGKHTITFLDHWVNYKSRFVRNGTECLPDEIWVGDEHAMALAESTFPDAVIQLVENPYFKLFKKEVDRLDSLKGKRPDNIRNVLFVSENIHREHFHQNDAIRFFMSNLDKLESRIGRVLIRPHPSESGDKYCWVQEEYGPGVIEAKVVLSDGSSLASEMAESDIVVGCSSMAMVMGILAHRRVISCIPDNEILLTLPFDEIELLSDIIKCSNRDVQ